MTDAVTISRETLQAAIDALDALDLKEDQIVGGQAGRIIMRVPVAAFGYAGRARDALRAALEARPTTAVVPLTDKQIIAIANACDSDACDQSQTTAFARAIERAHGIGNKP